MASANDVLGIFEFFCATWVPFWRAWRADNAVPRLSAPKPAGKRPSTWIQRDAQDAFRIMVNSYLGGGADGEVAVERARTSQKGPAPRVDFVIGVHLIELKLAPEREADMDAERKYDEACVQLLRYSLGFSDEHRLWPVVLRVRDERLYVDPRSRAVTDGFRVDEMCDILSCKLREADRLTREEILERCQSPKGGAGGGAGGAARAAASEAVGGAGRAAADVAASGAVGDAVAGGAAGRATATSAGVAGGGAARHTTPNGVVS